MGTASPTARAPVSLTPASLTPASLTPASLTPASLTPARQDCIRYAPKKLAKAPKVRGLMNVQLAVRGDDLYVIEVNPFASRTAPFGSKDIGVPLPKLASGPKSST